MTRREGRWSGWIAAMTIVMALHPSAGWAKRSVCANRPCDMASGQHVRPAAAVPAPPSPTVQAIRLRPRSGPSRHSPFLRRLSSTPRFSSMGIDPGAIRIIDGDTFAYGQERIRIQGVNAPELSDPQGMAAKQRLATILRQGTVRVVRKATDVYGRVVAAVYVNGEEVGRILARDQRGAPR